VQAAIFDALRRRDGAMVIGEGAPVRWRLRETAKRGGPPNGRSVGFSDLSEYIGVARWRPQYVAEYLLLHG
jgi:hypothetical protein